MTARRNADEEIYGRRCVWLICFFFFFLCIYALRITILYIYIYLCVWEAYTDESFHESRRKYRSIFVRHSEIALRELIIDVEILIYRETTRNWRVLKYLSSSSFSDIWGYFNFATSTAVVTNVKSTMGIDKLLFFFFLHQSTPYSEYGNSIYGRRASTINYRRRFLPR